MLPRFLADKLRPKNYANRAGVVIVPKNYTDAIKSEERDEWLESMQKEMEYHRINKNWTLVEKRRDAKWLDSRWVYRVRKNNDSSVNAFKDIMVIKGFKQRHTLILNKHFPQCVSTEQLAFNCA